MVTNKAEGVQAFELVLPCPELDKTVAFFTDKLGFELDVIFPADNPTVVVISGHGLRLRLERQGSGDPGTLRLLCRNPAAVADGVMELTAPNGTRVLLVEVEPPLVLPPEKQSFVLTRLSDDVTWGVGRAGMLYRDLIPDRQGGRFIASHIRIPDGGPVPDHVHFHKVRFQIIYCFKGWVRVAYEDQGPPLTMNAGDCVLQPPQIRHRVLECSPGLEVIEIGCPAEHETRIDHDMVLPTPHLREDSEFSGQRFVHHLAAEADWQPWRIEGFECRDTGIASATDGLAGVRIVRLSGAPTLQVCSTDTEFLFMFVLQGTTSLHCEGRDPEGLEPGDCFVMPAHLQHGLAHCSDDLQFLEVSLAAALATDHHPKD